MGQPLKVDLVKIDNPTEVTIQVAPLSAKLASYARQCLKLIDES